VVQYGTQYLIEHLSLTQNGLGCVAVFISPVYVFQ